jgi:hypothetical protein
MHNHPIHPSIDPESYWPYEWDSIPYSGMGDPDAAWKLGVTAGGPVVLWPGDKPFPEEMGLIPAYFHDSREELEKFFIMLVLGYGKDSLHAYQGGNIWLLPLSWRSYTLAQVGAVARIVHAQVTGADPWGVARAWVEEIQNGINRLPDNTSRII